MNDAWKELENELAILRHKTSEQEKELSRARSEAEKLRKAFNEVHGPYNTKYMDENDMKLIIQRINKITTEALQ